LTLFGKDWGVFLELSKAKERSEKEKTGEERRDCRGENGRTGGRGENVDRG